MVISTAETMAGTESPPLTAFQKTVPSPDRIACPRCHRLILPKTLRYSHMCGPDACQLAASRNIKALQGYWKRRADAERQKVASPTDRTLRKICNLQPFS